MSDLAALIRKRGNIKQKLTILRGFVQPLLSITPLAPEVKIELQLRHDKYETLIQEFNDIQTELEETCEETDLENHFKERESFEGAYFQVFSQIKHLTKSSYINISRPNSPTSSDVSQHSSASQIKSQVQSEVLIPNEPLTSMQITNNNFHSSNNDAVHLQGVKLPTIKLPVFKGNYDSWLEFKDTFNSLIHSNSQISEIQKFHYLRASLEGNAVRVIQSLEFSAVNYHNAWDLLCHRYDNKRLLVHNHLKALFSLEPINKESSGQIRQIVDNVSKHLRALNTLNLPTDHWDVLIIFLVTSKLDKYTLREWEEYKIKSELPSLDEMNLF